MKGKLALAILCALVNVTAVHAELRVLVYPVKAHPISSPFGNRIHPIEGTLKRHSGVDIAAPSGEKVRAVAMGLVVFAGDDSGLGKTVAILHGSELTTHYGHLSAILVEVGRRVRAGDEIGLVGQTGQTTGAHLHFELRRSGEPIDPTVLFPAIETNPAG